MGNNSAKHHSSSSRDKPKKNVHWKSAGNVKKSWESENIEYETSVF